jgi:carboxymethylenebutenolidase
MLRTAIVAAWVLFATANSAIAGSVKTQAVTFASGSETIAGYLATPESPGKYPAVVVIHDDAGLSDWVKERTQSLAGHGYVALAVDLYRGEVAHDPQFAYELTVNTPSDRVLRDLEAAIHFLVARADVNKEKVGSIGWSVGGKWSLLLAVNDPFLAACVVNYGSVPTEPADIQRIHAPVLGIFGADDRFIAADDAFAFEDAMKGAHKSIEIKMYRHAGHDFANPTDKLGFDEAAADDAWQRTIAFLDQHLK